MRFIIARCQVQMGDLNLTGAKIDSFRSAIWFTMAILIPNPNPLPNPSRSEPNNFSFNSLLSFRSPIILYNNSKLLLYRRWDSGVNGAVWLLWKLLSRDVRSVGSSQSPLLHHSSGRALLSALVRRRLYLLPPAQPPWKTRHQWEHFLNQKCNRYSKRDKKQYDYELYGINDTVSTLKHVKAYGTHGRLKKNKNT